MQDPLLEYSIAQTTEDINESIGTLLDRLPVQSLTMVQRWFMHRQARVKLYS